MSHGFTRLIRAFRRLAKSEKRKHSVAWLYIPRTASALRRETLFQRAEALRKGYAAVFLHFTNEEKGRLTKWDSRSDTDFQLTRKHISSATRTFPETL